MNVTRDIWEYWYPACQYSQQEGPLAEPADPQCAELHRFWAWGEKNAVVLKLLMLALAANASVLNRDTALTFTKQETLAGMVGRSERWIRHLLRWLEAAQHIRVTACDGICGKYHGRTSHYLIFRPPDAPDWSNVGEYARRRPSTRSTAKTPAKSKS